MANRPRVYLDSCCYIELAREKVGVEDQDRKNDLWCLNSMLQMHLDEKLELMTSTLSIAECRHAGGSDAVPDEIKSLFSKLLTSGRFVTLIQDTILVAELARDLLWVHGITGVKGADAIHIASAIQMSCDSFVTFDTSGMHAKASELAGLGTNVIYPRDFMEKIPGEYRQRTITGSDDEAGGL